MPETSRQSGCFPLVPSELNSDFVEELSGDQKRRMAAGDAETKFGLSYMHGEFHRPSPVIDPSGLRDVKVFQLRMQTQQLVEGYVHRRLNASSAIRPREAIGGLLEGRSPYISLSVSNVVPCQIAQVALPKDIQSGPFLEEMLPELDSNMLAGFEKQMLGDASEVGRLNEALGTPNSFMDAKLKRSGRVYGKFILACRTAGLVVFSLGAHSVQGVFFVKKKER